MPAAIKLSEAVYERFGHQVVGELVDALNLVDADYRAQLEKLNEANTSRVEARMDARFAQFEARMDARFAQFEAKMDARFAELGAKIDARFAATDARFAAVDARMAERFEAHTKWMMGGWAIVFATMIATLLRQ